MNELLTHFYISLLVPILAPVETFECVVQLPPHRGS